MSKNGLKSPLIVKFFLVFYNKKPPLKRRFNALINLGFNSYYAPLVWLCFFVISWPLLIYFFVSDFLSLKYLLKKPLQHLSVKKRTKKSAYCKIFFSFFWGLMRANFSWFCQVYAYFLCEELWEQSDVRNGECCNKT